MTSIPSNLGPAVTLGQDAIKPSRQTAEERQLFEEARIRGENKAAREDAEAQEIIDSTKDRTLVLTHDEYPNASAVAENPTYQEILSSPGHPQEIFVLDIPELTDKANDALGRFERGIRQERPDLIGRDWDFSIDKNNELVLKEADSLSESDIEYLEEKLGSSGLNAVYAELRDTIISGLVKDRGDNAYSKGLGRFDLSESNFSEALNFREYKSDTLAGGNGQTPTNSYFTNNALWDQLSSRTEDKYSNLKVIREVI